MFRTIGPAILLMVFACVALSASDPVASPRPKPLPSESIVVPAPAPQPTEVKIISVPTATPAEVKIVSTPPDESERAMVRLTVWILFANALLCLVTFIIGMRQSGDAKRSIGVSAQAAAAASTSADAARDSVEVTKQQARAQMVREINRAAHKVMVTATRLKLLASEVPTTRNHLHVLLHQGGMPAQIKQDTESTLLARHTALDGMVSTASDSSVRFSDLEALSDKELAERLWGLDEQQVRLEAMEDTITHELHKYESESLTIRQQNTAMQAAALNATMSKPLKNKLGE
jgi:hypothetical protein